MDLVIPPPPPPDHEGNEGGDRQKGKGKIVERGVGTGMRGIAQPPAKRVNNGEGASAGPSHNSRPVQRPVISMSVPTPDLKDRQAVPLLLASPLGQMPEVPIPVLVASLPLSVGSSSTQVQSGTPPTITPVASPSLIPSSQQGEGELGVVDDDSIIVSKGEVTEQHGLSSI
jgi:hypothetical protein